MKYFNFLLFILLPEVLFSQKMYQEKSDECLLQFILEDNDKIINYEKNDSLLVLDFLEGLEEKYIDRLVGGIMVQVMVDTVSQVCCVSYTNKTTLTNRRLDIPYRLKNMQGWSRVEGVLVNDNICALLSILFDKNYINVVRTGYNRNSGKQILSSTSFLRYKPEIAPSDSTEVK